MKKNAITSLFMILLGTSINAQFHNPWNIQVELDIGPSNLALDDQLPSEKNFLQSPFNVPYDTAQFIFAHDYRGIWIRSQGRVELGLNLQFTHEDGYTLGIGYKTGFIPNAEPRQFTRSNGLGENYNRSIEVALHSIQAQVGWDFFHERWNISKSHSLKLMGYLGYSWMSVDDYYSYHYEESNGNNTLIVDSEESFTWNARGINWGFGLEYVWFPYKSQNGLGLGASARFERHYLQYGEMNRNTYFLNGTNEMSFLSEKDKSFLFDGATSSSDNSSTHFHEITSHTDNLHIGLLVCYRFGK